MAHCEKTRACTGGLTAIGGDDICDCGCDVCLPNLTNAFKKLLRQSHGPQAPAVAPAAGGAPAGPGVDPNIETASKGSVGNIGAGTDKGSKG
jgi:hypothetical protein